MRVPALAGLVASQWTTWWGTAGFGQCGVTLASQPPLSQNETHSALITTFSSTSFAVATRPPSFTHFSIRDRSSLVSFASAGTTAPVRAGAGRRRVPASFDRAQRREEDGVANRVTPGQHHREPVDPEADATGRRHAV
jgi:hypothetical protein